MKSTQEIYNLLKEKFQEKVIQHLNTLPKEEVIEVRPESINEIVEFLRDDKELHFDNLILLSGVDDANGSKNKLEDGTEEITGGTLSVYYHIESMDLRHKLVLKVSAPRENPEVESIYDVYGCANWHEREAFDMLGIIFKNHPDLTRILMPYDWEFGYPLRKDYRNPEFYQGMKVPY
ncbi:MAG: NADH-quinone oxidoreductase subunit C [Chlorobiaceae bacterium]|nr:NADH-quinone oxidoreductase subunit C [Chlorobiaceae bacterium]MBA4310715.1 NADH-quinone oxidoreductase subunit C [Chlorobiaceae bacterium]